MRNRTPQARAPALHNLETWDELRKSFGSWDEEGEGPQSGPIAGIAVIADIARDRKTKTF